MSVVDGRGGRRRDSLPQELLEARSIYAPPKRSKNRQRVEAPDQSASMTNRGTTFVLLLKTKKKRKKGKKRIDALNYTK